MKWPAQLPDINLIENIWTPFKKAFHNRFEELFNHPSKSLEACYRYEEVLQKMWYDLEMDLVNALVESMSAQVQAVSEANNSWTKY